ncbi:hypothetical protein CcaverHIS002_0705510 [Cutaneotrichosporon cavernicola]|uniref:Exocyst complex protein EXO70 n=1 Tax=Cutaneotrichosporon cavernicola TaxID=279322 RepID=A0AA48LAL0_9TREE|nr:uncharacterized protein CcaverHIS019_0705550 [Cutaneotrichosporon cavernicola]BEI87205.1 hypothetical protein CcaverHIS002_0705510 [Cutaneotrichosporon cavernicola]BEI94974.1 hypothetical protein CcaverHIS019_0705550 [Cutaneotrichosporon cavernicola]BEJ02748.1 hypothetical protein CcaverHIS631_0705430 [Cutaneotrichosporon cavernicola]BEJ10501.1 hypothetical protein CcaverHIS641_0705360 [Cutaneotrichosporon cavernicola]
MPAPDGSIAVDEETDLTLLTQHLVKTNSLSQRMTGILFQLDGRLSRLDKSIAPLGIRQMTRQQANIDAVLEALAPGSSIPPLSPAISVTAPLRPPVERGGSTNTVNSERILAIPSASALTTSPARPSPSLPSTSPQSPPVSVMDRTRAVPRTDIVPRWQESTTPPAAVRDDPLATGNERAVIARGPDIMSLKEYFGALKAVIGDLEPMYQGLQEGRGGTREQKVAELSALLEDGFSRLVELLISRVKETMPRPFDPEHLIASAPQPVTTYYSGLSSVKALSTGLVALVEPAQPTPRATEIFTPMLGRAINALGDIRGDWLRRSLAPLAHQVEEAPATWNGLDGDKVRLAVRLWDAYLVACDAEVEVARTMLPGAAGERLVDVTIPHGAALLSSTMGSVISSFKRNLSDSTLILLNIYDGLSSLAPRYDAGIARILSEDVPEVRTALRSQLAAMRALALRSFPERLADIRAPPRSPPSSTQIDDTTHVTLTYLEQLPVFGSLAETLLRSTGHGERAWLMGGAAPSGATNAQEEGGIVNLYAADVLGTLIGALEGRAKGMRKPVGAAYLLNNLSHIRNTTSSFNADIIGPAAEDMLNKHFREAKNSYLSEWALLVQLLSHTAEKRFNVGSADKQSTKEAAASFFDRLAELEMVCRQHPLSRQDPELRERMGNEVADFVRQGYTGFWTKAHSKGYDKYLRQTPDELSRRVQNVFR